MDSLSIALGLTEIQDDLNIEELYEQYDLVYYNREICKQEAIERNKEIVQCDKCGVQGNRPNMMRWHFENCKTVLLNCQSCGKTIPRQGTKDSLYKQKKYCNRSCYMETKKGIAPIDMTDEVKNKLSEVAKKRKRIKGRMI
jgi:hypothetical protein